MAHHPAAQPTAQQSHFDAQTQPGDTHWGKTLRSTPCYASSDVLQLRLPHPVCHTSLVYDRGGASCWHAGINSLMYAKKTLRSPLILPNTRANAVEPAGRGLVEECAARGYKPETLNPQQQSSTDTTHAAEFNARTWIKVTSGPSSARSTYTCFGP